MDDFESLEPLGTPAPKEEHFPDRATHWLPEISMTAQTYSADVWGMIPDSIKANIDIVQRVWFWHETADVQFYPEDTFVRVHNMARDGVIEIHAPIFRLRFFNNHATGTRRVAVMIVYKPKRDLGR